MAISTHNGPGTEAPITTLFEAAERFRRAAELRRQAAALERSAAEFLVQELGGVDLNVHALFQAQMRLETAKLTNGPADAGQNRLEGAGSLGNCSPAGQAKPADQLGVTAESIEVPGEQQESQSATASRPAGDPDGQAGPESIW